jgi:hypothetical protein
MDQPMQGWLDRVAARRSPMAGWTSLLGGCVCLGIGVSEWFTDRPGNAAHYLVMAAIGLLLMATSHLRTIVRPLTATVLAFAGIAWTLVAAALYFAMRFN